MNKKTMIFGAVLAAFLILMIPNVSAINKQTVENTINQKFDHEINDKITNIFSKIGNINEIDLDFKEFLFKMGAFVYWAVYTILLILANITLLLPLGLTGVIYAIIGFYLAIKQKTGDALQRVLTGLILPFIVILLPWVMSFHLWTGGKFMQPEGEGFMNLFSDLSDDLFNGVD